MDPDLTGPHTIFDHKLGHLHIGTHSCKHIIKDIEIKSRVPTDVGCQ